MRTWPISLLLLASILWGSDWIIVPGLREVAAPFAAVALPFAVAAALLGVACLFVRPAQERISLRTSVGLGFALLAGPSLLFVLAARHEIGGWPLLLLSLEPLMLGIFASRWSAAMAVAPAAVLVLLDGSTVFAAPMLPWIVMALAAVGVQAWALAWAARRIAGHSPQATLSSAALASAVAAIVLFGVSLLLDPTPCLAPVVQWHGTSMVSLLLLGSFAGALPYALLWRVLASPGLAPHQIAVGQWVQTLVALVESAWFAHARLTGLTSLGFVVLAICPALVLRSCPTQPVTLLGTPGE